MDLGTGGTKSTSDGALLGCSMVAGAVLGCSMVAGALLRGSMVMVAGALLGCSMVAGALLGCSMVAPSPPKLSFSTRASTAASASLSKALNSSSAIDSPSSSWDASGSSWEGIEVPPGIDDAAEVDISPWARRNVTTIFV